MRPTLQKGYIVCLYGYFIRFLSVQFTINKELNDIILFWYNIMSFSSLFIVYS